MTDPTPESVEDALMSRLVALVDAWRANGTEPSAMALASIAGIAIVAAIRAEVTRRERDR